MPEPCGLVVTCGSNSRARPRRGSPAPSSSISIRTPPVARGVRARDRDPCRPGGLASTALTTRPAATALSSAGTAATTPGTGAGAVRPRSAPARRRPGAPRAPPRAPAARGRPARPGRARRGEGEERAQRAVDAPDLRRPRRPRRPPPRRAELLDRQAEGVQRIAQRVGEPARHLAELGELLGAAEPAVLAVELGEALRHPVERGDRAADLVVALRPADLDRGAELAAAHALGRRGEARERPGRRWATTAAGDESDRQQRQVPQQQLRAEAVERRGDLGVRDRNPALHLRAAHEEDVARRVGLEHDLAQLRSGGRLPPVTRRGVASGRRGGPDLAVPSPPLASPGRPRCSSRRNTKRCGSAVARRGDRRPVPTPRRHPVRRAPVASPGAARSRRPHGSRCRPPALRLASLPRLAAGDRLSVR